jgi:hypothetical protein
MQKFGVNCDGYLTIPPTQGFSAIRPRQPTPNVQFDITSIPLMASFRNEQDYLYFRYFQDETTKNLGGFFEDKLWLQIIPQACHNELVLRDLTISISALILANNSPEAGGRHREYAYKRYATSIRHIQNALNTRHERDAIRIALISSILICCFENFQGDHDIAVKHMESSLKLMRKRFLTGKKHTFSLIRQQSDTPHMEHDLLSAFIRIDNSLMSRPGVDLVSRVSMLDIQYGSEDLAIPSKFNNIREARNYLEHLQYTAMPVLSSFAEAPITLSDSDCSNDHAGPSDDDSIRQTVSSQLESWHIAFKPLIDYEVAQCTAPNSLSSAKARLLHTHALATGIALHRDNLMSSPEPAEDFVSKCWEIITLCMLVINYPEFIRGFVWDCGVVTPLFMVIASCDDREVRKEAIKIVRSTIPRREFLWDAAAVADFGDVLLNTQNSQDKHSSPQGIFSLGDTRV